MTQGNSPHSPSPQSAAETLRLFLTGVVMGAADIVPGVSGGTMALILGVYERLINGIKAFNVNVVKAALRLRLKEALALVPWQFLLALALGILAAVFTLSGFLSYALNEHPVQVFAFFFGLVAASILAVSTRVQWQAYTFVALALGTLAAYALVGFAPAESPYNDPVTLFFSGMIGIMAMILPGISGAFILLILGQYNFVLDAVKNLDIVSVGAVGLGAVIGLMGFSRVLSWLLARYENITVAVLIGLMIGSLRRLWPWKETLETYVDRHGDVVPLVQANILPETATPDFLLALALMFVGFMMVSLLDHLQSQNNPVLRWLGWRPQTQTQAEA